MPPSLKGLNFRYPLYYKGLTSLRGLDRYKCELPKQVPQRKRRIFEPLVPILDDLIETEFIIFSKEEYI